MRTSLLQTALFSEERLTLERSLQLTADSLNEYGERYDHWCLAYSGGKDSSATVAAVTWLIGSGRVRCPKSLTVLFADTRLELPPLHVAAMNVMAELSTRTLPNGSPITTRVVLPRLEKRFFVYMFGRGVPPSHSGFRWCTGALKVDPMTAALKDLRDAAGEKFLMLTGVRVGESAARDQRISLSCSKNGAECGQGYFQQSTPAEVADTLAPLIHWRVCHVWDWLAAGRGDHGLDMGPVADAYGGEEALEINARTGCVGCPVAGKDTALDSLLSRYPAKWGYLAPLKRLKPLYDWLSLPGNRLRQERGRNARMDASNTFGPLTLEARVKGLHRVLEIERDVCAGAESVGRPPVSLINAEELALIETLLSANGGAGTWPSGWTGTEARGTDLMQSQDGERLISVQVMPKGGRQVVMQGLAEIMETT